MFGNYNVFLLQEFDSLAAVALVTYWWFHPDILIADNVEPVGDWELVQFQCIGILQPSIHCVIKSITGMECSCVWDVLSLCKGESCIYHH